MTLFGKLKATAAGAAAVAAPALLSKALANTKFGSLQGLVDQLRQGGLEQQVQSWLGNSSNLPISADQLRAVLSEQHVQQLAQQLGVPTDKALELLAQYLPQTVDQASPNGKIEEPST